MKGGAMRGLRIVSMTIGVVMGIGLVVLAVTIGDCSAFGGRCPSDPGPILEDDVFGMAALGSALATGLPVFLVRPSKRRLLLAVGVAISAGVAVGLIARSLAAG